MRGKRLKNYIEFIFLFKLAYSVSSSNTCKTIIGVLYLKLQKLMERVECISG